MKTGIITRDWVVFICFIFVSLLGNFVYNFILPVAAVPHYENVRGHGQNENIHVVIRESI